MANKGKKALAWIIILLLLVGSGFCYYKFFWVFSDGTKTGELNTLTYTGYLFKTYEGEIILTGYGSKSGKSGTAGTVQSKNFKFSVSNREVADKLRQMTGLRVTVHYKEYKGKLPWRGYENAIVDAVVEEGSPAPGQLPPEDEFFL